METEVREVFDKGNDRTIKVLQAEVERLRELLTETLSLGHCPFCEGPTPCGNCESCLKADELGKRITKALEGE